MTMATAILKGMAWGLVLGIAGTHFIEHPVRFVALMVALYATDALLTRS